MESGTGCAGERAGGMEARNRIEGWKANLSLSVVLNKFTD